MKHKFDLMNFIHMLLLCLAVVIILSVAVPIVFAQECGEFGYNCDDNSVVTEVVTSVSNVIGGNENLAIGLSSPRFGAAIGDCMGTQARTYLWGIYGQQTLTESYWCEAANLYKMGLTEAANYVLCNHTILKTMPDCPGPLVEFLADTNPVMNDELPAEHIQQHFEIADSRYSELTARFDAMEVSRQANIRAAARKQAEEKEYNQQILEQVRAVTEND